MSTDEHDKNATPRADRPVMPGAGGPSLMPVTRLVSRPSMEVINGRLVPVLALVPRAA